MAGLRYLIWMCTRADERRYAYSLGNGRPSADELNTDEAKSMLAEAADFGAEYVFITGGEPFLRQDILDLIKFASRLGLKLYLKTSGWAIAEKKEIARELALANCKVLISIAGLEKVDNMLRGEGAYERSVKAASICSEQGILYSLSVMNTKYIVHQIKELVNLALELGSDGFSLACLVPQPICAEEQRTRLIPLEPSAAEHEKELNEIYLLGKQLEDKIRLAPYDIFYNRIIKTREPDVVLNNRCCLRTDLEENDWLEVQDDGKAYVCGPLGLAFGDIRKDKFDTIMRRIRESDVVRKLADPRNLKGKCGFCEFNVTCGGCRGSAYIHTGDMFAEDPHCPYKPKGGKVTTNRDERVPGR
ncbi:MAG: radical SAM protein [Chloroflexota bacterium]